MDINYKTCICLSCILAIFYLLSTLAYFWTFNDNFAGIPRPNLTEINAKSMCAEMDTNSSRPVDLTVVKKDSMINILWINKPQWKNLEGMNYVLATKCHYRNCRMNENAKNVWNNSAIIFSTQNQLNTTLDPKHKPRGQVWIFQREEPPLANDIRWIKDPMWNYAMNWSMGYRRDSDLYPTGQIFVPRKTIPHRNYTELFKKKTKVAAWVVSHCTTQSRREDYVKQLISYGVPVDIFGKCSPDGKRVDAGTIKAMINKHYKFYLSFENSFCKDYVTEKFYDYFKLDVVTIVRGGINYTQRFDGTTFINAADFDSAKALAKYIMLLNSNEELYVKYFKQKDKYEANIGQTTTDLRCVLWERLNNKEEHYNLYENMHDFLFKDACYKPTDL